MPAMTPTTIRITLPVVPPGRSTAAAGSAGGNGASGPTGASTATAPATSAPPGSSRNGGYSSRIRSTYAATRSDPAVEAEDEVVDPRRVALAEEERDACEEDEQEDQAGLEAEAPHSVVDL